MSSICNINICKCKSFALCHCCNKNLCFNHLKKHHNFIQSQLNSLVNQINILHFQLNNELNNNLQIFSHDIINEYFVKRINQLQKNINQLRLRISERISEENATNEDIITITLIIYWIKEDISKLKQINIFNDLPSFITNKFIPIEQSKIINEFDISTLSLSFQTIICQNPVGSALASNNQQLLMDQRLNLHLFDEDLILKKEYQWKYGFIRHMCWSSTLNSFIFLTNNNKIYLVNDNITSIEFIQTIEQFDWCCCTCSDTSLFLTTNHRGTDIFQFNLSLKFELIQRWKSPDSCLEHELIHHIIYNNQRLALIIENSLNNMIHIELRSSINLDLIWSFRFNIRCDLFQPVIRCCSLKYDEWLLIDSNNSRLFHIDCNGKLKGVIMYEAPPWNAILLDSNILAIRTENYLNFHQVY